MLELEEIEDGLVIAIEDRWHKHELRGEDYCVLRVALGLEISGKKQQG